MKKEMKTKNSKKCKAGKALAKCATAVKAAKADKKAVTLTVHAEKGQNVYLAGEFNGWDPTAKKMTYVARKGIYSVTIKLPAGTYQYKFVINGTWCADPENVNAVPNDQGTFNSVLTVQ